MQLYLFKMLDLNKHGFLGRFEIHYFFRYSTLAALVFLSLLPAPCSLLPAPCLLLPAPFPEGSERREQEAGKLGQASKTAMTHEADRASGLLARCACRLECRLDCMWCRAGAAGLTGGYSDARKLSHAHLMRANSRMHTMSAESAEILMLFPID